MSKRTGIHRRERLRVFYRPGAALLLFSAALGIRLLGIGEPALQGDEFLWVERSRVLIEQLQHGRYSTATTHLKHPGIPPAFILGSAQAAADYYNSRRGILEKQPGYLRPEVAARASNALVSSLCAPLIFLLGASFVGAPAAFVGGALLAFAPHHIEVSRVVHLDGMLSCFVTLTVLLYAHAVRRSSLTLKLLAGLAWGLCIATKPTAASLVGVFLVYKAGRGWLSRGGKERGETNIIAWSDIAAVLAGHLLLGAIYTRLWVHGSSKLGRFQIYSPPADLTYQFGVWLQQHAAAGAAAALLLFAGAAALFRWRKSMAWLPLLLSVLLAYLWAAPAVVENTIRYWTFALGLSHEVHTGGWGVWQPPPYGYAEFFVRKLPGYALIGVLVSFVFLAFELAAKRRKAEWERTAFHLLCLLVVIIWTAPLNLTTKQDFRYALPAVPLLYFFIAIGYFKLWRFAGIKLARARMPQFSRAAVLASPALVMCAALYVAASSYPYYSLHFSAVSGGLKAAKERRIKFPLAAHRVAIRFLHERAVEDNALRFVRVVGDMRESVEDTYFAMVPPDDRMLNFHNYFYPIAYNYVLVLGAYKDSIRYLEEEYSKFAGLSHVYSYEWKGVEVLRIYRVEAPEFLRPYRFAIPWVIYHTGGTRYASGTAVLRENRVKHPVVLYAEPGGHRAGYLIAGLRTRIAPGRYRARFELARPGNTTVQSEIGEERFAIRLDFGDCQTIVTKGELSIDEFRWFDVHCSSELDTSMQLRAYWFGTVPLVVRGIEVLRAGAEPAAMEQPMK